MSLLCPSPIGRSSAHLFHDPVPHVVEQHAPLAIIAQGEVISSSNVPVELNYCNTVSNLNLGLVW